MFFNKSAFFSIIILGILVFISSWLVIKSVKKQIKKTKLSQDFIINQAENIHYDKVNHDGHLTYSIFAKSAIRYINEDALLSQIEFFFYNKNEMKTYWHLSSDYAKCTEKNNKIHFFGQVTIENKNRKDITPKIKITTNRIFYTSLNDTLKTDDIVTIIEPNSNNITTGIGFLGNLKQGNFSLLNNVESYYDGKK